MSLDTLYDPTPFAAPRTAPLLDVENLTVCHRQDGVHKPIIEDLNLSIRPGEVLALVGESGSGKSMTALSLMRLLPRGLSLTSGKVNFDGEDVLAMNEASLNRLRGGRIAMLFQQPQAMLDPTSRVWTQVAEPLQFHRSIGRRGAFGKAVDLLRGVGIPDPVSRARCYAQELSGGMAQRVMIATAMSANPQLLIADEPTTALDVTVQAQILRLMDEERVQRNLAILLITHDLSIVSAFAHRIAVMYAGRIVEEGSTADILKDPRHPYTRGLIQCSMLQPEQNGRLLSIPGSGAQAKEISHGCRFQPRCSVAHSAGMEGHCSAMEPSLAHLSETRQARCHAVAPDTGHI